MAHSMYTVVTYTVESFFCVKNISNKRRLLSKIGGEDWNYFEMKRGGNANTQLSALWPFLRLSGAIGIADTHTFPVCFSI